MGAVAINLHRPVTRKRNSTGKWYVGFVTEQETQARTDVPETAVGIDVGLEKFASLSTGETIPNPRFFRRDARDLQRASRRLSAEEKRTPERAKRRKVVGRIHERIANRRKDFAHQFSRTLVARFGVIVFEDLSIAQMLKHHHLAKSIADATWNQLNHYPSCKAEEAGTRVVVVNPRGTSQRGSRCSFVVKKSLGVRVHTCPACNLVIGRDLNAAYNILRLGLQTPGLARPSRPL